jgi:O-acetyl-ADP-ribose deacetylase (regulator of RNase III)
MLTERIGDLFEQHDLDALAHGVNLVGAMGRGIAADFKERWPEMFHAYEAWCRTGVQPGAIFVWRGPPLIYNLATQRRPGAHATLAAIETSVHAMLADAASLKRNINCGDIERIGIPRLGSGLGGLRWEAVRPVLEAAARDSAVELVVVARPEDLDG